MLSSTGKSARRTCPEFVEMQGDDDDDDNDNDDADDDDNGDGDDVPIIMNLVLRG